MIVKYFDCITASFANSKICQATKLHESKQVLIEPIFQLEIQFWTVLMTENMVLNCMKVWMVNRHVQVKYPWTALFARWWPVSFNRYKATEVTTTQDSNLAPSIITHQCIHKLQWPVLLGMTSITERGEAAEDNNSLFTLRKHRPPLILDEKRGFLSVNRLNPGVLPRC